MVGARADSFSRSIKKCTSTETHFSVLLRAGAAYLYTRMYASLLLANASLSTAKVISDVPM